MQFGETCYRCITQRYAKIAQKHGGGEKGERYVAEIRHAMDTAPQGVAMPYLSPVFGEITARYYGEDGADYEKGKKLSNELMLSLLPDLQKTARQADDPLKTAFALAQIGNYIDFTALYGKVDFSTLKDLLHSTECYLPEENEYRRFLADLSGAKSLVYICDNAGEIVADRVAAEQLHAAFPALSMTFAVRGLPTVNDALREDAVNAGLDQFGRIVDNGSGISGTEMAYLGQEMKDALEEADVIVAKGQGNFETMLGCGLNVYYSFLCKCERFTKFFGVEPMTGMFVNEKRLDFADFRE